MLLPITLRVFVLMRRSIICSGVSALTLLRSLASLFVFTQTRPVRVTFKVS